MISIQTNTDSIKAQNNLNINQQFQSKTIQSLTSGYRINSSGDDAAGLAVANGLRDDITELTQGVSNASDATAQLQIVDGGLSNISTILDRMKTLATESASGTFTGNRGTLNQEYQGLVSEITRQATNVGLNSGGSFNKALSVYIGGASSQSNASITVDLSGSANAVDATSLGLSTSNVLGGGVGFGSGNTTNLNTATNLLAGSKSQTYSFQVFSNGSAQTVSAQVTGSASGISGSNALSQLNSTLNAYGITASTDSNGGLQFSGGTAFTVSDGGATGGTGVSTETGAAQKISNTSNYNLDAGTYATGTAENLSFTTSQGAVTVALDGTEGLSGAISAINAKTASIGLYAVENSNGDGISLQSANNFSVADDNSAGGGAFNAAAANYTPTAPTGGDSSNASSAITAINNAIQQLGLVQGAVGAGENKLQYATNLANSQISNYSTAESNIRDADVAAEAANLTKAQVLQQSSIAAMAQANSEPQAVLKLLQG